MHQSWCFSDLNILEFNDLHQKRNSVGLLSISFCLSLLRNWGEDFNIYFLSREKIRFLLFIFIWEENRIKILIVSDFVFLFGRKIWVAFKYLTPFCIKWNIKSSSVHRISLEFFMNVHAVHALLFTRVM